MATSDSLAEFTALANEPPATFYATIDVRNATPSLAFDAAADEAAVFSGILPHHYGGGPLGVTLIWYAPTVTTGAVVWTAALERQEHDGATSILVDAFGPTIGLTSATAAVAGRPVYATLTFTPAQVDGLLRTERFRLRVTRDADAAADTLVGDALLLAVHVREG